MSNGKITTDRNSIIRQLNKLLEPWLNSNDVVKEINEQTNLLMDTGIDSVGLLQLILSVEEEFDITIKDDELDAEVFSKMGNLLDIIESKICENN